MHEAVFYHALNIAVKSDYRALRRLHAAGGSWEACWWQASSPDVDPARAWEELQQAGISLVLAGDPAYPPLLAEIPHPPFGIYFKGNGAAAMADIPVAIVGTRKASGAGKALAQEFAAALARAGCAIVSGLAFGIDAAAHTGALAAPAGVTVAVLANGLDRVYPSSHERLAAHIIERGGALLSEYPPGSPPLAYRFLERNRLISGLAQAVLLVEAPERSGVLATARFAMEQNRDLYAVPGPVSHPNYKGSHRLIRAGAALVSNPGELLEDLGLEPAVALSPTASATPAEACVLAALRAAGEPLTIDEISEAATLTSSTVNQTLTLLALQNLVREENGRYSL